MKKLRKIPLILAVIMLIAVIPLGGLAAIPDYLDIASKSGFTPALANAPALSDGQIWMNRGASSDGVSPVATVTLSALGQGFQAPTVNVKANNVVFVLDYSSSMQQNSKAANMATAANAAVEALNINNNQMAVVEFYSEATLKRGLSTAPFTLTTTGSDDLANNKINVYPPSGNGTNIQAGLNAAYNELLRAKNAHSDSNPVIILLTDGAPTYYYQNIQSLLASGTYSGNGSSTTNNEIAYTAVQAAYLKLLMPELRIYTISFDTSSSYAQATLNPTDANIAAVSGLNTTLTTAKGYVPDSLQGKIVYNYTSGYYTAANSTASLNAALNQIIRGMNNYAPVAVTNKTNSTDLADTSYIYMYDTVGQYFTLGSDMTLTLSGASYPFTYNSGKGEYVYATPSDDANYNASVAGVKVLYDTASKKITWMIPGNVLPCRDSGGGGSALPIRLSYTVTLEGSNLQETTYNTSSSCTVNFTPASNNPYYSSYTQKSSTTYADTAVYYSATFPSTSSGSTTLWSFASGSTSGSLAYSDPSAVAASYSTSNKALSFTADGKAVSLSSISSATATAAFTSNNLSTFTLASFKIGGTSYAGTITGVTNGSIAGTYNITVSYNGGNSKMVFTNVAMLDQNSGVARFRAQINGGGKYKSDTLDSFTVNGVDVTSAASASYDSKTNSFTVTYNGNTYTYKPITYGSTAKDGWYYTGDMTCTIAANPRYGSSSVSTNFYTATGSVGDSPFAYTYDPNINKVTLTINGTGNDAGTFTFRETVTATSNTQIVSMSGGGFIIKVTEKNSTTGITTVTTYTLDSAPGAGNGTLTITVSDATPSGPVSNTVTSGGSMTLESNSIINNVTLTAANGTATTFADTTGQATVVLTFTSKAAFSDMTFTLSTSGTALAPNSTAGFISYSDPVAGGGLIKSGSGTSSTFSASAKGTYTVTFQVTNPYGIAKSAFVIYMTQVNYKTSAGTAKTLPHFDGYPNQKVRVIFNALAGH